MSETESEFEDEEEEYSEQEAVGDPSRHLLVPDPGPLGLVIDPQHPERVARIENVVASYQIVFADGRTAKFDLPLLANAVRTRYAAFYDPKLLRALKFRVCIKQASTQPAVMLFSTGQVNQAGEQSPEQCAESGLRRGEVQEALRGHGPK